ncbi:cytochrome P450 monooxygenase pc-3 [Trametes elegans]|nr:cytochrome P450 monooxygenase pc-3 [Trametes elegans]
MNFSKQLPPGLPWLVRRTGTNLFPAVTVFLAARILSLVTDIKVSRVALVLLAIFSVPVVYVARYHLRRWRVRRAAARAGAVLPPEWRGEAFGGVDIVKRTVNGFQNGYLGEGFWDRIDELGHLHAITALGETTYATNDAHVMKSILATNFADFEKGEEFRDTVNTVLGMGVFNTDGELWKFHRQMTRPYFSRDRISHFELFDRHADVAIRKMKDRFGSGHALDFQDLISRFTIDSATEFLFGACVHSLKTDLPYAYNDPIAPGGGVTSVLGGHPGRGAAERFAAAFAGAQHVITMRNRVGWPWHLQELVRDRSAEHMRVVDAFLKPILADAIAKNRGAQAQAGLGAEGKAGDEDETLLDHLVKLTKDPVVLHDETLNILLAGRDTTAATLTFAVYMMCLYPEVCKRLRAEILETVGPTRMPTFEDVRSMKYLRAVINETLRLYPVVPFNIRVANKDTTLPNPKPNAPRVFVPAGTTVAYSTFFMQRRKEYWGPDAEHFDPDRWLDERLNKYFTKNPFIFVPFNAGPRICLGQQFAYNEMSFFLTRLLQTFSSMELDLSAQPPEARPPAEWARAEGQKGKEKIFPKTHLSMYVHGGLWVKMTEAERDA